MQCKEAKSSLSTGDNTITKAGDWIWVGKEPGNWVSATGYRCIDPEQIPKNIREFPSSAAAKGFADHWEGHPWYFKPNGIYEVIRVRTIYKRIFSGYERTGELEQVTN